MGRGGSSPEAVSPSASKCGHKGTLHPPDCELRPGSGTTTTTNTNTPYPVDGASCVYRALCLIKYPLHRVSRSPTIRHEQRLLFPHLPRSQEQPERLSNLSRVAQLWEVEPGSKHRTKGFWALVLLAPTPQLPPEMFAEITDLVKFITVCPYHGLSTLK